MVLKIFFPLGELCLSQIAQIAQIAQILYF